MRKLNSYVSILILTVSLFVISCGDDPPTGSGVLIPVDTSTFTYPFTNGSSWTYQRKMSAENIRPDSIRHYFSEWPFYSMVNINILYDTIINGNTAKCFLEKYSEIHSNDTIVHQSRYYYGSYDTALVCFATRGNTGGLGMPYDKLRGIKFRKNNTIFNTANEIFSMAGNNSSIPLVNDSLYVENPPAVSLKYPIVAGTEWVSKYSQGMPLFYKKYLSFNIEYMGLTPISCIKTQRIMPEYENTFFYEYYSKYGQIKRDYLFKDMSVTTVWMPDGAGYADIREMYTMLSYNIAAP
jgi:hypothetical protein